MNYILILLFLTIVYCFNEQILEYYTELFLATAAISVVAFLYYVNFLALIAFSLYGIFISFFVMGIIFLVDNLPNNKMIARYNSTFDEM